MTTEIEQNVIKDYLSKTIFIKDICKKYNISTYIFNNILKKNHIEKYDPHFLYPQNQRKYPLKEGFFFIQTQELAYLLGFLASDGTVRKDSNEIKLTLSEIDANFLEFLQKEIGGCPVKHYIDSKGHENATWIFTSKKVKDELATYNIVPNKTFTFSFPNKLERKYWIDFIRGYFDGNGCISTAGKDAIRWQLCSVNKNILETIISFLKEEYNIEKPSIYKRKDGLYYFQYSTVPTRQIFKILYNNSNWFLPRKKEKFQSII